MLVGWGVTPDPNVIDAILRPEWGKRPPPSPHSHTIYNAAEVWEALNTDPELAPYKWMYRQDVQEAN
jgi:hypothetical protein